MRAPILILFAPLLVASDWVPYAFKGTESFQYSIEQTEDGKTVTGSYELTLAKAGDKIKVSVKGELGDNAGSFSTTTSKPDDLGALILSQAFMNPWVAPLAVTIFTPTIFAAARGEWDVGSKWSRTEKGETITIEVPSTCEYAGRKGKLIRMSTNGETNYEGCIDHEVALPLYAYTGTYKAVLNSYSE